MALQLLSGADLIANLEELESSQALAVLLYTGSDPDISQRFDELAREKANSLKFFAVEPEADGIKPVPAGTLLVYQGKNEVARFAVSSDVLENCLNLVFRSYGNQLAANPPTASSVATSLKFSDNEFDLETSSVFLCNDNIAMIGQALGVDIIRSLLCDKIVDVDGEMLNLRTDDLSGLFAMVYQSLTVTESDTPYPHGLSNKADAREYVMAVIKQIKRFLEQKFKSQPANLKKIESIKFSPGRTFMTRLFRQASPPQVVRPDLSIYTEEESSGTDAELSDMFAVIVCKGAIGAAVMQAVVYLRVASDLNPKNNSTFAFCSDAIHYSLLSYNREKKTFKMSEPFKLMFSQMFEERYRETWMRENTEILRIIYTVVCEQLNLPTL